MRACGPSRELELEVALGGRSRRLEADHQCAAGSSSPVAHRPPSPCRQVLFAIYERHFRLGGALFFTHRSCHCYCPSRATHSGSLSLADDDEPPPPDHHRTHFLLLLLLRLRLLLLLHRRRLSPARFGSIAHVASPDHQSPALALHMGTMPPPPTPPHATPSRGSSSSSNSSSRPSTSHRPSTGVSQARRHATPKQASVGASGALRSAKVRGSSDKEHSAPVRSARRISTAGAVATREKLPSKDGTAQRNAKQVEGLKDYVRASSVPRGT
jgi:hypothetical protein